MKRAILSIRSRLILEAVTLALKRAGIAVEKTSSQSAPEILLACEAAKAHLLVMDVTRDGEGTFDLRMQTVKSVKAQNPDIKTRQSRTKSSAPRKRGRSTRSFMNPSRPTILPTRWTHCDNLKKERKQ